MGYMGDVKTKTFIDDNASSATFVAAAARPTSTFTLAASSFGTNTGRKITATTADDDTFMTLGYYYDPKDRKFHVYKDNVKVGTGLTTNVPDDEELAVSFAIQNGAAAAKVMTLDYISAGKERTANTEL